MSYGAAFGSHAMALAEAEWRKNSGRITSRSGGRRRRRGGGDGEGGGNKESWDDQRARMRKEEAERRWRMGSGPKPDHVAEREHRDKTRSLDIRERESGLADADQARRNRAAQERRASEKHSTDRITASVQARRDVEDLGDHLALADMRRQRDEQTLQREVSAGQITTEEQALKTLGRVSSLLAGGDTRGAARYMSADPAFGIQGATNARVVKGPDGPVVEFINDDGHVIPGDGGRPARFKMSALEQARAMFAPREEWKSGGGGIIYNPGTGDIKGAEHDDQKARSEISKLAAQLYRADRQGFGEPREPEHYLHQANQQLYPGRALFPAPQDAPAPDGGGLSDVMSLGVLPHEVIGAGIRTAASAMGAPTRNQVGSTPANGAAMVSPEEAANPQSAVYQSARAALARGVKPEVVARHLESLGGNPALL